MRPNLEQLGPYREFTWFCFPYDLYRVKVSGCLWWWILWEGWPWIFEANPPLYHWHSSEQESSLIWCYNHRLKEMSPNNSFIKALFICSWPSEIHTQAWQKAPVGWAELWTQSLMWLPLVNTKSLDLLLLISSKTWPESHMSCLYV